MNTQRTRLVALMTLMLSLLACYAALTGLLDKRLYSDLHTAGTLSDFLLAGSLAQDIITVPMSIILVILSLVMLRQPGHKLLITILGLNAFFFYGYGLYTIQGQYTSIYLVYLAIFGLSTYSLILGLTSIRGQALEGYSLPRGAAIAISLFLLSILLVLVPVWLLRIAPDIARHTAGETYGVFILDLALVFPALAFTAAKLLARKPIGYLLAGIALFKVLTVCLSVAFGEWFVAFYGGFQPNIGNLAIFTTLTLVGLLLLVLYSRKLQVPQEDRLVPGSGQVIDVFGEGR
ncbi:MAG TPA: hypothetical protein VHS59_14210 [Bacillota bacterium]|nr:hypothetical protein [Bacillota bacterium]